MNDVVGGKMQDKLYIINYKLKDPEKHKLFVSLKVVHNLGTKSMHKRQRTSTYT